MVNERLVELLVKDDLRKLIKLLKGDRTYDEFIRNLVSPKEIIKKQKIKDEV